MHGADQRLEGSCPDVSSQTWRDCKTSKAEHLTYQPEHRGQEGDALSQGTQPGGSSPHTPVDPPAPNRTLSPQPRPRKSRASVQPSFGFQPVFHLFGKTKAPAGRRASCPREAEATQDIHQPTARIPRNHTLFEYHWPPLSPIPGMGQLQPAGQAQPTTCFSK